MWRPTSGTFFQQMKNCQVSIPDLLAYSGVVCWLANEILTLAYAGSIPAPGALPLYRRRLLIGKPVTGMMWVRIPSGARRWSTSPTWQRHELQTLVSVGSNPTWTTPGPNGTLA